MRKLIIAALLMLALLLAPLLVLRSEKALIWMAHWAVETFTDLRLVLKSPVIQPFESVASAAEIHLYPENNDGPPFVSILNFNGNIDVRDIVAADLSRTRLEAGAVTIYVSDRDSSEDPVPLEWLQYLRWLPGELQLDGVHLVTASERTFIFPLVGLRGQRSPGGHFAASARAQYDGEPLDVTLDLSAIRDQVKFTGLDMTGRFTAPDSGSEVRVDGELRGTIEDFNYDFKLIGNYKDIGEFMRGFRAYNRLEGGLQVQARMVGNTDGFALQDAQFLLNNLPDYGIEAAGSMIYDVNRENAIRLVASGEFNTMEPFVEWIDFNLEPLGRTQGSAMISGTLDRPIIDQLILHSETDEGFSVNIKGHLELDPEDLTTNRIDVDVHGPRLAVLEPWTGPLPYETGAFSASAAITGKRDNIELERLIVELGSTDTVKARVEGQAENIAHADEAGLAAISGLELKLQLYSPDTANLSSLLDLPLPHGFELKGDVQLSGTGELLRPTGGDIGIISSDIEARITPTGGTLALGEAAPLTGLEANISLDVSDTSALSQFTTAAVPVLGPASARATLVQESERFALENIRLTVRGEGLQLQASGRVGELSGFRDTRIVGSFSGVEPRDLLFALVDDFDYEESLGELGGRFILDHPVEAWNMSALDITSREEHGPLFLHVNGSIRDLAGLPTADLITRYRIRDPALLETLTGLRMNPAEGSTRIRSTTATVDIQNSTRIGETSLDTDATINYAESGISGLDIAIDSPRFNLDDLGLQAVREGEETYNPSEKLDEVDPQNRLEGLLERSPRFPSDITVSIDNIRGENTNIESLDLHVTGLEKRYTLRRFTVGYDDTLAELRGIIDLNPRPPFVSIAGEAVAIPLDTLGRDLGRDTDIKGHVTVRGGLAAQGYSTEELLKDVDGSLAFALENAEIEGAAYDVLATDLLAWIYSGAAREKSTHIDCTMGQFNMLDGVAKSDSLYIETEKMVATGKAKIDMVREKLDITITPRSKTRQIQVPSSVRLRGDFEDPRVTISPVAAAFDAYAEFLTLLPRMVGRIFGGKREREKSRRPCEAVN